MQAWLDMSSKDISVLGRKENEDLKSEQNDRTVNVKNDIEIKKV